MKARYGKSIKRLTAKECNAVSREAANSAFPAVMAAVIFVLYKRGWHKDRLLKLYDDVCAFLAMGTIFGKCFDDEQVKSYLVKKIGIDWSKIKSCIQIAEE